VPEGVHGETKRDIMFRIGKTYRAPRSRMTESARPQAKGGIGHRWLIQHATQAETCRRHQRLVHAQTMFAGQFCKHLGFEQAAIEQTGVEAGQATGIAMTVRCRLLHAPPLRLIGAVEYRWWIGKGARGHGCRLTHRHVQQALRRFVADIALAASDMRHPMKLFVGQPHMEIQSQRPGDPCRNRFARATVVRAPQQFTHQPAIGDRRIAMAGSRLPPGCFGRQRGGHLLPVVECLGGKHVTQSR
jgi:hypothetical protein